MRKHGMYLLAALSALLFMSCPGESTGSALADAILEDVKNSGIIAAAYDEIQGLIYSRQNDPLGDYDFEDQTDNGLKVIASQESEGDIPESLSDKLKAIVELISADGYDGGYDGILSEILTMQFTADDNVLISQNNTMKGEASREFAAPYSDSGVSIAAGSMINEQNDYHIDMSVTRPGMAVIALFKVAGNSTEKTGATFNVATPSGNAKIVLDMTVSASVPEKEVSFLEYLTTIMSAINADGGTDPLLMTQSYSGSLKVYGEGSVPLKTIDITDEESYTKVREMLGLAL